MCASVLATLALGVGPAHAARARQTRAPVLATHGQVLRWSVAGHHNRYKLLTHVDGESFVTNVAGRRFTPPAAPGETAVYRVKAANRESGWSNAVRVSYAAPAPEAEAPQPPVETPGLEPEAPPGTGAAMTVGLNAGGWGPGAWRDVAGAVPAVRMEARFATEPEVGAAASAGVGVDSWLLGTGGSIGGIEPVRYAAEVVALFKRFGHGGTFWKGRPDLGAQAIEVLNEPDNPAFWRDAGNEQAYVNLLHVVHDALVASFPPATRPRVLASWDGGEGPSSGFGAGWVALGGLAYVDGVTVHPYGGSRGQDGGALGGRFDVEQARAQSGKPVYVTEVGWPTAVGQPATGDSQQWTETQQAANITGFIAWAKQTGYVAMVDIFNYVDYGTGSWYGIERSDRAHKLSYAALAAVSR